MKWLILLLLSFLTLAFMILMPFVSATSSDNYMINSLVISNGGTNVTSASYDLNLLIGDIAGNTNSSTYTAKLGFWFFENYNPDINTVWLIAIIISLLGTMAYMAYIAKKSEHIPIQILFFFIALFMGLACLHVANLIGQADIAGSLIGLMWTIIFSIALFLIYIFLNTNIFKLKYK